MQAEAATQLLLSRGADDSVAGREYTGVVELTVNPGFDDARVAINVDGQSIASGLLSPWRVVLDLGATPTQKKIAINATSPNGHRRVQWVETLNRGLLPLSVKVKPIDPAAGVFDVETTSPADDPVTSVELWHLGQVAAHLESEPYRFTLSPEQLASGFVQITARTKSGDEAADFWTSAGDVHVETLQVRTVPIFVSVVDREGVTQDDVDRSLFRVLDNGSEAKIVEFGKAFDQPISIALLLDASSSMTYTMPSVTKAAHEFVKRTLKPGDRSSIMAIQDVPRRKQPLTSDFALVEQALASIKPHGTTALYDAIESAMRELRDEKNRRAIVILTDGSDNASMATFDEIRKTAGQSGIPLYFIAYDTGDTSLRNIDRLRFLAGETGGFVAVATQQNLATKYGEIERDLRGQFAITYQISDYKKENEWRPIRVVMSSPKLTARTIKGYFTP
jgi:Ca-activated chloride channel homolog